MTYARRHRLPPLLLMGEFSIFTFSSRLPSHHDSVDISGFLMPHICSIHIAHIPDTYRSTPKMRACQANFATEDDENTFLRLMRLSLLCKRFQYKITGRSRGLTPLRPPPQALGPSELLFTLH